MVDALTDAWRVLRPGGAVVDLRPGARYRPAVALRRGRERIAVGPILRVPDADVAAAQAAVRRVVREGLFRVVARRSPLVRTWYADLGALERMIALSENWRLPAATRRRIAARWRAGDALELTRRGSLTVLRSRGRSGGAPLR